MATSRECRDSQERVCRVRRGRLETVLGIFDDDIEFVVPGNSAISGTYRGKAEVTELFAKVAEQSFTITPSRFLADDDVVVVLTQVTAGGESAPEADVFTFRDGKAVKAQNFGDTACRNGSSARSSRAPDAIPGTA